MGGVLQTKKKKKHAEEKEIIQLWFQITIQYILRKENNIKFSSVYERVKFRSM